MTGAADDLGKRLRHGPVVLDGAIGTELERRGVSCPLPLWSAGALLDNPRVVEAVHREYASAGAEILVANTFRTNPTTLRAAHRFADGRALNVLAVELARRATGRRPAWIAASVAPIHDCYCPERVPEEPVLRSEHRQMLSWLSAAAPDLIWIETMNTVREAHAAAAAAADRRLPFVVSFVVRENGDLLSGEALEAAVAAVEPFEPLALGLNCIPPRGMTELLPRLRRATTRPLAAYAHVGNPTPIVGWSYAQDVAPGAYGEYVRTWLAAGASIVGGCCGTGPDHIRAVRQAVDDWHPA